MTFLKVRNIVASELPMLHLASNLRRPRTKDALEVPTGFAFAIQHLGLVNVNDTITEVIFAPAFPKEGHKSGIPDGLLWYSNAYAQAVEYARSLGIQFSAVDLTKKHGSAWWLFRQTYEEEIFELQCSIPEVNFTPAMAFTHAMFLKGNLPNPSCPLFDLRPLGNDDFGIMMGNPHLEINQSCYEAVIPCEY